MPLEPGQMVGPYLLLASIGKGGMGEVFKARDSRLGREVALKVLLPDIAADPERLRRFENEAHIIGALNHPNLMAVYDTGTMEGHPYLVCELLDGQSLRTRLLDGPLPTAKAVDTLIQAARGLGAAHAKGILHRDLKPENIFLTRSGFVKLLDFGLAKSLGFSAPGSQETRALSPDASTQTQKGVILGTVGYMSPEQVRGEALDARSDIFALGIILFEMLTGQPPFKSRTSIETLSAILREEPPPLSGTQSPLPPSLEKTLLRCLEKDPVRRYQNVEDLVFQLQNLSEIPSPEAPLSSKALWSRRDLLWAGSGLVLGMGGMAAGYGWARRRQSSARFTQLVFGQGPIDTARFVPGSPSLLFSARWDGQPPCLFSMNLQAKTRRDLGITKAHLLAVNRREEFVYIHQPVLRSGYFSGPLLQSSAAGSGQRHIIHRGHEAAFDAEGTRIALAVPNAEGGSNLEFPPGTLLVQSNNDLRFLRVGDGEILFFEDSGTWGTSRGTLQLVDFQGNRRSLGAVEDLTGLAFGPRQEVWYSVHTQGESCLYAQRPGGKRHLLLRHGGKLELQDVDAQGRALLTLSTQHQGMRVLAPGRTEEKDLSWQGAYRCYGLSHDGRFLLLGRSSSWFSLRGPLFLRPTDGSPAIQVCEGLGDANLSPDGKWVVTGTPDGAQLIPAEGGTPKILRLEGLEPISFPGIFPDNNRVLTMARNPQKQVGFYALSPSTPPKLLSTTGLSHFNSQEILSPDGRWLAVHLNQIRTQGGDSHACLRIDLENGQSQPSTNIPISEAVMAWSQDSQKLFLLERNQIPAPLTLLDLRTQQRKAWRQIGPTDRSGIWGISNLKLTPDGKCYAYSFIRQFSQLFLLEGIR